MGPFSKFHIGEGTLMVLWLKYECDPQDHALNVCSLHAGTNSGIGGIFRRYGLAGRSRSLSGMPLSALCLGPASLCSLVCYNVVSHCHVLFTPESDLPSHALSAMIYRCPLP